MPPKSCLAEKGGCHSGRQCICIKTLKSNELIWEFSPIWRRKWFLILSINVPHFFVREEIEKQKSKERYMKLHLEGKTEQARADLARLAIIKKQREEAAKKRDELRKGEKQLKTYTWCVLFKVVKFLSVAFSVRLSPESSAQKATNHE